jgi:hypothetical protein
MFEEFAEEILKTEVATRGNHLKNCSGTAIVTGIKEDKDRSGKKAMLELTVLKVDPTSETDINYPGQRVTRQYRFQDGNADKRAAIMGNFKRDLCTLADVEVKSLNAEKWGKVTGAAAKGLFTGMLVRFEPYDAVNKAGEKRTYHNLSKTGNNAPDAVAKRAAGIAKGDGPETFL